MPASPAPCRLLNRKGHRLVVTIVQKYSRFAVRPVLSPPLSSFIAQRSESCHLDGRPGEKASITTAGWLPCSSCRTMSPVAAANRIRLRKCPVATQQRGRPELPIAGSQPRCPPLGLLRAHGNTGPVFFVSTNGGLDAQANRTPRKPFHGAKVFRIETDAQLASLASSEGGGPTILPSGDDDFRSLHSSIVG
jgi:hypothetical protein